jgi:polar amino acid transport system substrate-binding protein
MRRTNRLRLVALVALAMVALAACGSDNNKSKVAAGGGGNSPSPSFTTLTQGELKVGSCLDYRPFEYTHQGKLQGFDVEMVDAIAQKLGLKVVWIKANFDTIFNAVAAHKFDMVAAASTITPDRAKSVNFSEPYYNARQGFSVNTAKSPDIKTTDDLSSGDIVGVQKGTTGATWAEKNLQPNGVTIKTYQGAPDAFTDLEAGRIVGVINDLTSSIGEVANRPSLKVVESIDTHEHYGFAFAPDTPQLTVAVNKAFQQVIADGTYVKIFKKYFPTTPVPSEYKAS